jgi:phage-related protein (TIGR01555 family)
MRKSASRQVAKLKKEITTLRNAQGSQGAEIRNSLAAVVAGAQMQSNLTSFNPIIQNNIYAPLSINWQILTYMYKTHGIIQTAIDMPVLDALRGGLDIQSGEMDVDDIKELNDDLEENGIMEAIAEAGNWARLYGGGALIINTDQDPATPLDPGRMKRFELYAANRWEMNTNTGWVPQVRAVDGRGGQMMGVPGMYANINSDYFWFYGMKIHSSRVVTIAGKTAPYIIRWQLAGWGMSEVERMVEDFNAYIKTKEVLYELLEEAKIDVYQFENLTAQLATDTGTNLTKRRVQLMNELKSFQNAIVLDKNDVFEQKQITFAGLAEVMKENRIGIAAALRMPLTKLFGLSAAGFNSGEDDIENYNAMVESEVRQKLRRPIKKILNLMCLMKFGTELDHSFQYKPLRVLGAVEEEGVKTSKQNRYLTLYDRSLISSQEMGEITEKENLVPVETDMAKGLLDEHPVGPEMGMEDGEEDDDADKKKSGAKDA